jgi:pyruvate formate lyase activating enzyme
MTVLALDPTLDPTEVAGSVHSWDLSTGVDGPGTRFVVFTAGCPLRCLYCHNPDTWFMRNGQRTTARDVLDRAERYRAFLIRAGGGLTVSGGEPLLQPEFTGAVLDGARKLGLHTALDTSGALGSRADDTLLASVDLVLLDVKSIDPRRYADLTGGALRPTLDFAERLSRLSKATWVRYVLLPGWTDDPGHLGRLAEHLAGLGNIERVDVLGYHRLGRDKYAELGLPDRLAGVPAATPDQVAAAQDVFAAAGLTAT